MSSNPSSSARAYPVAFGAGILSFLSPCILPLIPRFAAFITGMSIWPNKQKGEHPKEVSVEQDRDYIVDYL